MNDLRLINVSTGTLVAGRLRLATTFLSRFRGLQFQKCMPAEEALLIAPCRSIHTHWMRFSIDVAMLNRDGVVVQFHSHVPPWRILGGERSVAFVIEMAAGEMMVSVHDRLGLRTSDGPNTLPVEVRGLLAPL